MTDLLEWLGARPRRLDEVSDWLGKSSRLLTDAWWHASDLECAHEIVEERLEALGVDLPRWSDFDERHDEVARRVEDEDQQRRHQLGFVAVHANARMQDGRRFYCLGAALLREAGEPLWALLSEEEHRQLLALAGPPGALEAPYSGATSLPAEIRPVLDLALMPPFVARRRADEAFARGDYLEALQLMPKAIDDGDHGVLAQLLRLETLRRLGRREEARALWSSVADEWLRGDRRAWDTQWRRLLELHRRLALPGDDARLAEIKRKT